MSQKEEEERNHNVPKFKFSFMNPTRHRQGVMGIWHLAVYNNQFHYNFFTVRLCLVAVKCFPENTYFPEMLISRKGKYFSVFGCISKSFPKNIFWCLEKKKENTNPEKHKPQPRKKSSTTTDRKSTRLNSSHFQVSRMPSSA